MFFSKDKIKWTPSWFSSMIWHFIDSTINNSNKTSCWIEDNSINQSNKNSHAKTIGVTVQRQEMCNNVICKNMLLNDVSSLWFNCNDALKFEAFVALHLTEFYTIRLLKLIAYEWSKLQPCIFYKVHNIYVLQSKRHHHLAWINLFE